MTTRLLRAVSLMLTWLFSLDAYSSDEALIWIDARFDEVRNVRELSTWEEREVPTGELIADDAKRQWHIVEIVRDGKPQRALHARTSKRIEHHFVRHFPRRSTECMFEMEVRAPSRIGRRGLSFGLAYRESHPIHRRAVEFTFHQNGTIAWFDGTMWYGITSFQPNRWYRIRVIANPLHGACDLYVNGEKRNTEPLPFWNSVPYVDTFFLSHFTHRGEEDDVYVGSVKLGEAPVPPTPMLLTVNATSPTSVRLHWLPVFYGHVARFRIYRANKLVATVPANRTQWVERGLQPGTAYAYAVSAIDDATPPNESIWTFPEMVITHPLNYPNRPSRPLSNYDVVIIGATPAGVAAGVMAARLGLTVALSNESERLGGMMASGLGRTDFRYRQSAGGIFLEFVQRCYELYRNAYGENSRAKRDCNAGYFFEPRIAAFLFERFVAEHQNIHLYAHHRLVKVHKRHKRIISADMLNMRTGRQITLRGRIFIDATYEGDLSALAGVPYRIGRESREEYGEEHAGVIYFDYRAQRKLTGSTGEGDYRVQAYNYRLCITKRPDWRIRISKPKHYNRKAYLSLLEDFRTGRVTHIGQILSILRIPNDEWDVNNHPHASVSTDLPEENYRYPEADWVLREAIRQRHREHIIGLLYFLQNDPQVPEAIREQARQYGWACDEFLQSDHFPTQLYVREARRIYGEYTFTEHDARLAPGLQRTPIHTDSIAVGDYPMDSHATQKRKRGEQFFEGFYYLTRITKPYQIPYRIIVPQGVNNLLVPVAVSATHVAFGTIRMEPVWMSLGMAAGAAAYLSIKDGVQPRHVNVLTLQQLLLEHGAVLTFFFDVPRSHVAYRAIQFFGTKGFFTSYYARPDSPIARATAAQWLWQFAQLENAKRAKQLLKVALKRPPIFTDIPRNHPQFESIQTLGYVLGITAKTAVFNPDGKLTRADAAEWLANMQRRLRRWRIRTSQRPHFQDVPKTHPQYTAIETLYRYGIVRGYHEHNGERLRTVYKPNATLSRGLWCLMLYRALSCKRH